MNVCNSTKASDLRISIKDGAFLHEICSFKDIQFSNISQYLNAINCLKNNYSLLDSLDIRTLSDIEDSKTGIALYRLYQIFEYSLVGKYNPVFAKQCLSESAKSDFILAVAEEKISHKHTLSEKEILMLEILNNSDIKSASILLAKCYFWGLGVAKNERKALSIINSYKKPFNSEFYYNVAVILLEFYGDEEQSTIMNFLTNASNMGYVKAMEKLMMIYKGTQLAKEDPQKHFSYAKRAAEHGSIVGLVRTGYCYAMGYGISKSIPTAKSFLGIAANHGSEDAKRILTILDSSNE